MRALKSVFETKKKYKTGIILSGGGARGFAHAGILKGLNESGIYPDVISGVSAGAIVGALYADGYAPDEIFEIFSGENSLFRYVKFSIPKMGLFKTIKLRENLDKSLRSKTFEELKIPLFIAATDITSGEIKYFDTGKILEKVMASSAIPVLFEPVKIEGNLHVDGGVLDNFPVTPIVNDCERLIGVSLNPISPEGDFTSLFKIAERTFRLSVSSNISPKIDLCDVVIEPEEMGSFKLLDASKGKEMFELGYRIAIDQIGQK